jgi:hypothetical protein
LQGDFQVSNQEYNPLGRVSTEWEDNVAVLKGLPLGKVLLQCEVYSDSGVRYVPQHRWVNITLEEKQEIEIQVPWGQIVRFSIVDSSENPIMDAKTSVVDFNGDDRLDPDLYPNSACFPPVLEDRAYEVTVEKEGYYTHQETFVVRIGETPAEKKIILHPRL